MLNVAGGISANLFFEILAGISLVAASYFTIKARKGTADDNEAVKTATLASTQIAALSSAIALLESEKRNLQNEITHLHELRAEDAKTAAKNAQDITGLRELVTQQAAVAQFRTESFAWFESIGKAVNATPPHFPDHSLV